MRGASTRAATSLGDVSDEGTQRTPHPPAPRRTVQVEYRSVVRLVVAEADAQGLTHNEHHRELDDLHVAVSRMTHAQRLARLDEMGEKTSDLQLPSGETNSG